MHSTARSMGDSNSDECYVAVHTLPVDEPTGVMFMVLDSRLLNLDLPVAGLCRCIASMPLHMLSSMSPSIREADEKTRLSLLRPGLEMTVPAEPVFSLLLLGGPAVKGAAVVPLVPLRGSCAALPCGVNGALPARCGQA